MAETEKSNPSILRQKPAPPKLCAGGTYTERYAAGKALRETCPLKTRAAWKAPACRAARTSPVKSQRHEYPTPDT